MLIEENPDFGEPIHARFPHSEPTNDELGIEPVTGWRLIAAWAICAAISIVAWVAVGVAVFS